MKPPFVFLVGAGPGNPSLITVRGQEALAAAGVVVYDHLVHPRLLGTAPPEAERIDVGPAAPKPLEQDAICFLLAEKAREGRIVVRLKWGDPFIFDSGGKEALFLHEQGVPFEVVPGVPALFGAPAYAGIPLTYPGAGDTVTLVRGYEAGGAEPPEVDWKRLAQLDGTIVCYAGGQQLPEIIGALLANGRAPDEWAALVYDGTMPGQHTVQGTLERLARAAERTTRQPAILVVGRAVGLREHLRWYDVRPLFGRRIVVTRSRDQAGDLVRQLEDCGADAIEVPTIRIVAPADPGPLETACRQAGSFDWIVFTSANGVRQFLDRLLAGPGDLRELRSARLCAIGPATAERLARYGLKADLMPAEYRAEAVVAALRGRRDLTRQRILVPHAEQARELLADELRSSGADVVEVAAYRTLPEAAPAGLDLYRMLLDGQIDAVTFTSASTVRSFARMLGTDAAADLLRSTVVASIGPVTAEAAQQLGIQSTIVPAEYTIPALVEALVDHFRSEAERA